MRWCNRWGIPEIQTPWGTFMKPSCSTLDSNLSIPFLFLSCRGCDREERQHREGTGGGRQEVHFIPFFLRFFWFFSFNPLRTHSKKYWQPFTNDERGSERKSEGNEPWNRVHVKFLFSACISTCDHSETCIFITSEWWKWTKTERNPETVFRFFSFRLFS